MPVAHLYPRPPYDFFLSAAIFAGGDPHIRNYEHGIFRQALDFGGNPVLVDVFSKGLVDAPDLCISLCANTPFSKTGI
ncbi:MAG: hypothetical protein WC294_01800 [Methanoregula sp.]|jgi:hypothetical protein